MKALSIRQPFAHMLEHGRKTIEVRSKPTKYRGEILICASLKIHDGQIRWQESSTGLYIVQNAKEYAKEYFISNRGVALAVADLHDCTEFEKEHEDRAMIPFIANHYAWHFKNVEQITPYPVKGQLGIYNIDIPSWHQTI